jgi:clan AA aspartic protease (TIGR02281 family)
MQSRLAGALALCIAALSGAGAASAACVLNITSEYHVTMDGNRPLVDASINGHPVRFLVDLGSARTIISPQGAAQLGLTPHRMSNVIMYGVGGGEVASETMVGELTIGNAVARNVDVMIAGRGLKSERFIGLLGQDFLSQADIEFDFANGLMRLIKPKGCEGDQVVYNWKAYMLAAIVPSNNPKIIKVYVALNGQKAVAQIDSGAYTSVVDAAMAERAGVTPRTENVTSTRPSTGVAGAAVASYVAVFPTLAVGDEQVANAKLLIADLFQGDERTEIGSRIARSAIERPDMLLGADFLRAHHVYVARSQGKVYFSYNGGPIFQVVRPAQPSEPQTSQAPAETKH